MIVAAAREIDPSTLTLQAVATRLGVDRKAITYHVSGLDELTALLAAGNLADELADLDLSDGDWRDAVRAYAVATRDTLLRTPSLAMVIERIPGAGVLRPVDALAGRLFDAGFDEAVTQRPRPVVRPGPRRLRPGGGAGGGDGGVGRPGATGRSAVTGSASSPAPCATASPGCARRTGR